jgi:hypothetical protein
MRYVGTCLNSGDPPSAKEAAEAVVSYPGGGDGFLLRVQGTSKSDAEVPAAIYCPDVTERSLATRYQQD